VLSELNLRVLRPGSWLFGGVIHGIRVNCSKMLRPYVSLQPSSSAFCFSQTAGKDCRTERYMGFLTTEEFAHAESNCAVGAA
jgi:hypothetical protein